MMRRGADGWFRGLATAGLLLALGGRAAAEPAAQPSRPLSSRQGVVVAQRLLTSADPEDRWRGLERLGTIGSSRALELLVRALDEAPGADRTGRLVVARALAPHADQDVARQALVQLLTGAAAGNDPSDRLAPLVRSTAALALARNGSPEALRALAHAIRTEGPAGEAAADALLAHPPRELEPLLGTRPVASTSWLRLLAELGDQRAFLQVRRAVTAGPAEVRAAAAVALTELGALETVELARHWYQTGAGPTFERAAAEILALTRASEAPEAIARLLEDPQQRAAGLDLALRSPDPRLVGPLAKQLEGASDDEAERLIAAIGRAGGQAAIDQLVAELAKPVHASAAAYALALAEGKRARQALERALARPESRRLAARAAVVRAQTLRDEPRRTGEVLEALLASSEDADRSVGAWGLAALDPRRATRLIEADDPVVAMAAASTVGSKDAAVAAVARLERATTARERIAYARALAVPEGADCVSTATLLALLADGGAATPLAALVIARRDAVGVRPHIERLLRSDAVDVRAHAALGLGASRQPSSVGLLERAYRFEVDADVRRAIVAALGQRSEATRVRVLELAAQLDGDAGVRSVARLALAGQTIDLRAGGIAAVWLRVEDDAAHAVALGLPTGLTLPLLPDPEGFVVQGALSRGPTRVRLAALPLEGKALSHGTEP